MWGHDDPPERLRQHMSEMEANMDKYLSSFPASHWREKTGEVWHRRYPDVPQKDKLPGMMVLERGNGVFVKFNIILHVTDPMADVARLYSALQSWPMLCIGSSGKELIIDTTKENINRGFISEHASEWDIIFRTHKLLTFKCGITMHGDLVFA